MVRLRFYCNFTYLLVDQKLLGINKINDLFVSGRLCTSLSDALYVRSYNMGLIPKTILSPNIYGTMTLPTLCIGDVYKLHLTGCIKIYGDILIIGQQMIFTIPDVMGNATFDMLSTIDEVDFEIDISIHVRKANKFLSEFYTFF